MNLHGVIKEYWVDLIVAGICVICGIQTLCDVMQKDGLTDASMGMLSEMALGNIEVQDISKTASAYIDGIVAGIDVASEEKQAQEEEEQYEVRERHIYNVSDPDKNLFLQFINDEIPLLDFSGKGIVYFSEVEAERDTFYIIDVDEDGKNEFGFRTTERNILIKYDEADHCFKVWLQTESLEAVENTPSFIAYEQLFADEDGLDQTEMKEANILDQMQDGMENPDLLDFYREVIEDVYEITDSKHIEIRYYEVDLNQDHKNDYIVIVRSSLTSGALGDSLDVLLNTGNSYFEADKLSVTRLLDWRGTPIGTLAISNYTTNGCYDLKFYNDGETFYLVYDGETYCFMSEEEWRLRHGKTCPLPTERAITMYLRDVEEISALPGKKEDYSGYAQVMVPNTHYQKICPDNTPIYYLADLNDKEYDDTVYLCFDDEDLNDFLSLLGLSDQMDFHDIMKVWGKTEVEVIGADGVSDRADQYRIVYKRDWWVYELVYEFVSSNKDGQNFELFIRLAK
ncbi:MAG: hypothetical protein J1E61_04175 [Lachnospiraceae bacterium]|nr:hypothetical protein [Lachnospiraceae bacterium]